MQKRSPMFAYVRICPLNWRKNVDDHSWWCYDSVTLGRNQSGASFLRRKNAVAVVPQMNGEGRANFADFTLPALLNLDRRLAGNHFTRDQIFQLSEFPGYRDPQVVFNGQIRCHDEGVVVV